MSITIYNTIIEYNNDFQKQILINIKKNNLKQFKKLTFFDNEDLLCFFTKNKNFFISYFMKDEYTCKRNKLMEKIFCILVDNFPYQINEIFCHEILPNYNNMTAFDYLIINKKKYIINTKLVSILNINYKYNELNNDSRETLIIHIIRNYELEHVFKIINIFSNVCDFFTCIMKAQNNIKYNIVEYCVSVLMINNDYLSSFELIKYKKILCHIINIKKKNILKII